jgi:hypothetical protein
MASPGTAIVYDNVATISAAAKERTAGENVELPVDFAIRRKGI